MDKYVYYINLKFIDQFFFIFTFTSCGFLLLSSFKIGVIISVVYNDFTIFCIVPCCFILDSAYLNILSYKLK